MGDQQARRIAAETVEQMNRTVVNAMAREMLSVTISGNRWAMVLAAAALLGAVFNGVTLDTTRTDVMVQGRKLEAHLAVANAIGEPTMPGGSKHVLCATQEWASLAPGWCLEWHLRQKITNPAVAAALDDPTVIDSRGRARLLDLQNLPQWTPAEQEEVRKFLHVVVAAD